MSDANFWTPLGTDGSHIEIVVERTCWSLGRSRRLSKDYEAVPASTAAWIYLAMIQLMLRRLQPTSPSFSHTPLSQLAAHRSS